MILLDGHSLTAARLIPLVKMGLKLKERDSSANMTPEDEDGISVGSWLKDDRDPGKGIVWRVRSIQKAYNAEKPQVTLEHIISTLKDRVLFGEVKPSTITGDTSATTCTARQAVEYILGQQSDWTLGQFDYDSVSNPYKFDGDTLFDALETVTNSLEDAYWTYDMSAYPFTLNIVQKSEDVDSELRAGRNLKTISRTVDKSGMYTRFYPIGKDDLHIPGDYVEKNAGTYGVISKVETDTSLETVEELIAWANERLNMHAQPVVTIMAEGLELSKETGENLDALTIGRVCRVPLPEYGTTIQERINELDYSDKVNKPKDVKVTMANSRTDVTKIIAEALKSSGKSKRQTTKQNKEDHAWFEDTNDHVAMVAEGIIGVDAQGNPNWTRLSEFIADGEGLHAKVETQINGVTDRISSLEITEEAIRLDVSESKSAIYSVIEQTASAIRTEVANTASDLRSTITQTAAAIRTEVSAAGSTIYSVIEQTATNIRSEVRGKARVYVQIADPVTQGEPVSEGDIWIKSLKVQSWDDFAAHTWQDASSFDWKQYAGAPQFIWDGTRWEPIGDQGAISEYETEINQTNRKIELIARAVSAIDPDAINLASLEITADAITSAVSTAKSEIYSLVRQTATNIVSTVANNLDQMWSTIEQTASSVDIAVRSAKTDLYSTIMITLSGIVQNVSSEISESVIVQTSTSIYQAVAKKNRVFIQMTDPASTNTVIDGDIWIKSAGNNNIKPTWSELSARSWTSQNSTNWREYYEGYWYVRKGGAWQFMNANADVVEIGTFLEQDEKKIALIARDVDANHQELGARLEVTAQYIRSEVHAAKSNLYSVVMQTATSVFSGVYNKVEGNFSTITQTACSISLAVASAKCDARSYIDQTASSINIAVAEAKSSAFSYIDITAQGIEQGVADTVAGLESVISQSATRIALVVTQKDGQDVVDAASIVLGINGQTGSYVKITASTIDLSGYVKATSLDTDYLKTWVGSADRLNVRALYVQNGTVPTSGNPNWENIKNSLYDVQVVQSGNTYTLQKKTWLSDWVDVGSFSRATSLSGSWSGRTHKVTASPQGNEINTVISVYIPNPQGQPTASTNAYVATGKSTAPYYETHGDAYPLYLVKSGLTVNLRNVNSSSGGVTYASTTCSDSNLKAANIKKDVTIFGVTGTLDAHTTRFQMECTAKSQTYPGSSL